MNSTNLVQRLAQIELGVRTAARYVAACYTLRTGRKLNSKRVRAFTKEFRIAFAKWAMQKENDRTPLEVGTFTVSIGKVKFRVQGAWVPIANIAPVKAWGVYVTEA